MEYITAFISLMSLIISVIVLTKVIKFKNSPDILTKSDLDARLSQQRTELIASTYEAVRNLGTLLDNTQNSRFDAQKETLTLSLKAVGDALNQTRESINLQFESMDRRIRAFTADNEQRMDNIRNTVSARLDSIRDDNNKKLDEMRKTVDEKLQSELERRFKESFAAVGSMLENVQQQIGSMRTLAEDVGGLKRTLSNVKSRGMMGEFQLESILIDIFARDQYEKNAHPVPESNVVVEFALKIPTEDNDYILLPIDAKFPRDRYDAILVASDACDKVQTERAMAEYLKELRREAKDISTKYIAPPHTTDYGIMFLPTESMYADAVNHNMLQELWQSSHVYLAGPSTICALLSSLQLAFNNMAIQKRAGEVFGILNEVKSEFTKFSDVLIKMQTHLNQANNDLSSLIGVRSKKITSRLNSIAKLSAGEAEQILPLAISDDE